MCMLFFMFIFVLCLHSTITINFSLHCRFNRYASIYRFYQTYNPNVVSIVSQNNRFALTISKLWKDNFFLHKKRNNKFRNSMRNFSLDVYTYWTNMAHHIWEETAYLFTTFVSLSMLFLSCKISGKLFIFIMLCDWVIFGEYIKPIFL